MKNTSFFIVAIVLLSACQEDVSSDIEAIEAMSEEMCKSKR